MSRRRRPPQGQVDPAAEAAFVERLARDPLFLAAQAALALKIVLVVLIFDPNVIDAFALVKSAASHATSLVLGILLLDLLLVHGRRLLVWSPAHLGMGALVVFYSAASVLALDQETALFGMWRRYLGLGQMLDNALLYCAAVILLPTVRDLARLAIVALSTAGVVVLYMFIQRLGLDPVTYTTGREIPPPGTFGQPDVAGAYAAIAAATSIALAVWVQRPMLRAALLVLALACGVALILDNARGGIVALGFGWVAIVAVVALRPAPGRRTLLYGLIGGVAVAAAALAATPLGARFFNLVAMVSDTSAQSRLEIWGTALTLLSRRPLLGIGPDNFGIGYPTFREQRSLILNGAELQTSTHNWLLHVATSAGVLGTVALVALLATGVVLAIQLARRGQPGAFALVPLSAYFGQGLVTVNDLGTDWIPWLTLGVIAAASGRRLAASAPRGYPRWVAAAAGALALLLGAAGVVVGNQRITASDHFGVSQGLVNANRGAQAVPEALAAVQTDPRRAEYWSGLGVALSSSGNAIPASFAFAEAGRLKPSQALFWSNLALMRLAVNDTPGAALALSKATAADPFDPPSRDLSARVAFAMNDWERASREGHLAVELQPTEWAVYETPAQADVQLGRLSEAEQLLRSGLRLVEPSKTLGLHVLLAQVLHAQQRDAEARAEVAAALAIDPTNAVAQRLEQAYK